MKFDPYLLCDPMTRSSRSTSTSRWSLGRALAAIGGLIALVGFAISLVQSLIQTVDLIAMLYALLGMLISIFVLLQVQLVRTRKLEIPFNWWLLLILAILQAILLGLTGPFVDIAGLGILLEVVAVILLLLNAL